MKRNPIKSITFLFSGLLIATPLLVFQDIRNDEILILIDRPPNTLLASQSPDVMARKILPLLTELHYSYESSADGSAKLDDFTLTPPDPSHPRLHFQVAKEDLTRGVKWLRNQADVIFDGLSLSKTNYFRNHGTPVFTPEGFHLSFIGFNLKHPALSRWEVRRAIQLALPIELWARHKYFGFVTPLRPPEFDPSAANSMLDQAGYRRKPDGARFTLRYLTTPVREGQELALLTREALRGIGIRVEIMPLESSLFFNRLNHGEFELFGSRILRANESEPVNEFLKTGARRNYFSYSNSELDQFLGSHSEATFTEVSSWVEKDLPLIPLFTWNHGIVLSKRIRSTSFDPNHFDDSFRFLSTLLLN